MVRPDYTIIDGFHRWTVSGQEPLLSKLHGQVPVVKVAHADETEDIYGTITHNRARGTHLLEPMKAIVKRLLGEGKSVQEIGKQLGMRPEEVFRLSDFSREDFLRMMTEGVVGYSKAEALTKISIVLDFLQAQGDSRKMQVVYNTVFGKLWENRGDLEDEDSLLQRRDVEPYGLQEGGTPIELPDGVLVLTCGIDTQDDRLEYEVVGHGHFGETWGIEKGIIMGRPDADETWTALDANVLDRLFHFEDGLGLPVSLSFQDEGGHFTQEVRQRCRDRIGKKLFCVKGIYGQDRTYTGPPKQVRIVVNQTHVGSCWQYQIGVDAGKQHIMDNLRVKTPGPRYCHFPKRDDYGAGYFSGLLSERLTYNEKNTRHPWQWEKIPGHERNEALDCRNYAMAAFEVLPKNLDAIDRQIQAARGKAVGPLRIKRPRCLLDGVPGLRKHHGRRNGNG